MADDSQFLPSITEEENEQLPAQASDSLNIQSLTGTNVESSDSQLPASVCSALNAPPTKSVNIPVCSEALPTTAAPPHEPTVTNSVVPTTSPPVQLHSRTADVNGPIPPLVSDVGDSVPSDLRNSLVDSQTHPEKSLVQAEQAFTEFDDASVLSLLKDVPPSPRRDRLLSAAETRLSRVEELKSVMANTLNSYHRVELLREFIGLRPNDSTRRKELAILLSADQRRDRWIALGFIVPIVCYGLFVILNQSTTLPLSAIAPSQQAAENGASSLPAIDVEPSYRSAAPQSEKQKPAPEQVGSVETPPLIKSSSRPRQSGIPQKPSIPSNLKSVAPSQQAKENGASSLPAIDVEPSYRSAAPQSKKQKPAPEQVGIVETPPLIKSSSRPTNLKSVKPRDVEAMNAVNRGVLRCKEKHFDEAVVEFTIALTIDPTYDLAFWDRGYAYNELRKFDLAYADLSEAIRLNEKSSPAYSNRALANLGLGRLEQAVADADVAILLDDKNGWAHYYRAIGREFLRADPKEIEANYGQARSLLKDYEYSRLHSTRLFLQKHYSKVKQ